MAFGGLITRPTLAMLGERGPEIVVPVGRPARTVGGEELGPGRTIIEQQINIEGVISDDTLLDFMQKLSELVRSSDAQLDASSSLRVVSRS
jgi:hypothetical protein